MTSIGVYLPRAFDAKNIIEAAKHMERLGFESVWVTDHLFDPYGKTYDPFPECWTTLTAIACATEKIKLGPLVLCNAFRSPTLVAKMSSTLDRISNGRLNLGIGAGWYPDEHQRYGFPLRESAERIEALRESIEIIRGMWTKREFSFSGKFYRCSRAVNEPKPLQKAHPPLLIGGKGRRMLALAASYADIYNASGPGLIPSPTKYEDLMKKLESICMKYRRDFDEIRKTWGGYICLANNDLRVDRAKKGGRSIGAAP